MVILKCLWIVLSYRDVLDDRMDGQGFMGWCLAGVTVCWVGCPSLYCFVLKAGSRYWCVDGAGTVCVLPADLFGRHLHLLYCCIQSDQQNNTYFNKSVKLRPKFYTQLQIIYFLWRTSYHWPEDDTWRTKHFDPLKTHIHTPVLWAVLSLTVNVTEGMTKT